MSALAHGVGSLDLALGESLFLEEHLMFVQAAAIGGPYHHPVPGGEPELLFELQRRHHGMHVVVFNGAKQAISAALTAYAEVYNRTFATHLPPYWPSYRILAARDMPSGLNCRDGLIYAPQRGVRIITSPNNPDGSESTEDCDIWNAVYASPVYGFTSPPAHWTVAIYSAAKMLGLSGLRVGWAVTSDARLAQSMSSFVERYTSGVCVTAQRHVAYALRHLRIHDDHTFFDSARAALLRNGQHFTDLLGFAVEEVHGVPAEGKGAFAWFRFKPEYAARAADVLKKANVLVVGGADCGVDDSWVRMSMSNYELMTLKALRAIAAAFIEAD